MGVPGSTPGGILFPVAFVGLVIVRYVILVLGHQKPVAETNEQRKGAPMSMVKEVVSAILETTWALGASMVADLPLLT